IVGLIAAGLAQLPIDAPAILLLKLIEPCTWWIYHIAAGAQQLPLAVIAASPIAVLLAYGWIIAGLVCGHPRKTFAALAGLLIIFGVNFQPRPQPLEIKQVHTVNREEDIDNVPAGTQAIIVLDGEGHKSSRGSKPLTASRCSFRSAMGKSPCIRMEPSTLRTGDFRCSMMVCMEPEHLIVGDDEFLAERARRSIQKAVAEETGEQPELKILRAAEVTEWELIEATSPSL